MAIKFLNTVAVDTDVLYVDASSNNVGIGTTSPTTKLHVTGDIRLTNTGPIFTSEATNGTSGLRINTIGGTGGSILRVQETGTTKFQINYNGDVGIGTTSPADKLDVNGRVVANAFRTDVNTGDYSVISRSSAGNAPLYVQSADSSTDQPIAKFFYGNASPNQGSLVLNVGKDKSYFTNTNVGIGTTNPSEKLEVAGNAIITGDVTLSNGNALRWTSDDVRIEGTTAGDNIKFYVANTEILQLAQSGTLATVTGNLRVTGAYYDSSNSSGTSGQVLSSTATGTDWVSLSEISGVDGTGTANYLAKWSDTDTITDSVIYDNGTNVGIGTTDFGASSYANWNNLRLGKTGNLFFNTATNTYGFIIGRNFYFASDASYKYLTSDEAETISFGDGNIDFRNATTGTEDGTLTWNTRMRIDSSGNVGIGTTSPSQKLEVIGGDVSGPSITWKQTNRRSGYLYSDSAGVGIYDTTLNNAGIYLANNSRMDFRVNGSERMRITSAGNVGIGTTSPQEELHIASTVPVIRLEDTDGGYAQIVGSNGSLSLRSDQANTVASSIIDFTIDNSERMRIASDGNVGIGTTSPVFKLDVSGNGIRNIRTTAGWAGWFENTGSSSGVIVTAGVDSGDAPLLIRKQDGTELFSVRGNGVSWFNVGNVGIGTTSPQQKLQVASPSATSVVLGASYLSTNNNNFFEVGILANDGYLYLRNSGVVSTVHIDSDGDSYFNGGNVGIGTTSPGDPLTVVGKISSLGGTNNAKNVKIYANDSFGYLTTNASKIYMSTQLQVDSGLIGSYNEDLQLQVSGSTKMYINSAGSVGIGTTSPSTKLSLAGNSSGAILSFKRNNTTTTGAKGGLTWIDSSSYYVAGISALGDGTTDNSGELVFRTSTGEADNTDLGYQLPERMRIDSSGNVGIGTTSPGAALDVSSSSTSIIRLSNSDTALTEGQKTGSLEFYQSDTSGNGTGVTGRISMLSAKNGGNQNYYGNAADMIFQVAAPAGFASDNATLNALTIKNSSGNVGIGTTDPQSKLQVDGGVQMADDTDTASADKVGTLRYRTSGNNSYVDMCMQTGATTYEWVNIVQNNW